MIGQVSVWNHHCPRERPAKATGDDHVIGVEEHVPGHVSEFRVFHERVKVKVLFLGIFAVLGYLGNEELVLEGIDFVLSPFVGEIAGGCDVEVGLPERGTSF